MRCPICQACLACRVLPSRHLRLDLMSQMSWTKYQGDFFLGSKCQQKKSSKNPGDDGDDACVFFVQFNYFS